MFDVLSQWMDARLGCGTIAEKVDVFERGQCFAEKNDGVLLLSISTFWTLRSYQLLTVSFCLLLITSDGVLIVISVV